MQLTNHFTTEQKKILLDELFKDAENDFFTFANAISKYFDPDVKMNFETYKMSCEVLQAFIENRLFVKLDNEYKRTDFLFFNACPGWGKSYVITRLFNIWWFAKQHKIHFVITASEKNRKKIMTDINLLFQEKFFSALFPSFSLMKNNDSEKVSNKNGWLNMNPSRSDITGNRGDLFILDDFDKPTHVNRAEHETSKQFLNMYLTRGFKSPNRITKTIVVAQRVAKDDTTGYLQDIFDKSGGSVSYVKLEIPYKFNKDVNYKFYIRNKDTNEIECKEWLFNQDTFSNPYFNEEKWSGEVLYKECNGDVAKRETQYQQNPTVSLNSIIKKEWFKYYVTYTDKQFIKIFITADTAIKVKEHNDYSVFCVWGLTSEGLLLLDMSRGKWEAPELRQEAVNIYNKWKSGINYTYCTGVYIEDKASGSGLIQDLQRLSGIPVIPVPRHIDKLTRVQSVLDYIFSGRVFLPRDEHAITNPLLEEAVLFTRDDSHKHDDIIDCLCDAINIGLSAQNMSIFDTVY